MWALSVTSCGDDTVSHVRGGCTFGEDQRLGVPEGGVVHGISLAADGEHAWAAWSDRSGAFVRALDGQGRAIAPPVRVGAPCDAGIAIAMQGGIPIVACARAGDLDRGEDGGVQVLALRDGQLEVRGALGPVGPDGEGVAIDPIDPIRIGWQEGRGAARSTWVAELRAGALPERLSSPRLRGGRPALFTSREGERIVAWSETWLARDGDAEGRIRLRVGARAARSVADVAFELPLPVLRAGAGGEVVLAFRDRRPETARTRVHVARVVPSELTLTRLEAAAHANAEGEALAIGCGDHVYVVAPRTRSRTERLVSVRRYGRELAPEGPEQQIHEHGAAFEHADARCLDGALIVMFAERVSRERSAGSIRTVRVTCPDAAS